MKMMWGIVLLLFLTACSSSSESEEVINEQASMNVEEQFPEEKHEETTNSEQGSEEQSYTSEYDALSDSIPSCGDEQELFVLAPIAVEAIKDITPLGNLAPSAHTFPTIHLYWNLKNSDPEDESSVALSTPLYAPSDMYIRRMSRVQDMDGIGVPDYALQFFPCKEFFIYFDHISTLSEKIEQTFEQAPGDFCEEYTLYYESGPRNWQFCRKDVEIFVEKGEQIGTVGGGRDQKAFDIGAYDYRNEPHVLANPERWQYYADGNLPYVVCALEYFSEDIREGYEALIPRTESPICGEVVQDLPGTAQGNWVPEGTSVHIGDENTFLALVHDNYDPSQPVFSIGIAIATIPYGEYIFELKSTGNTNRDFSDITPEEVYCYEDLSPSGTGNIFEGIILLQMLDVNTLKIEGQNEDSCMEREFSGQELVFER